MQAFLMVCVDTSVCLELLFSFLPYLLDHKSVLGETNIEAEMYNRLTCRKTSIHNLNSNFADRQSAKTLASGTMDSV